MSTASPMPPRPTVTPTSYDDDLVAFGVYVRARRHAARMTQEELARASGLHWTYISQIERGMRNITYKSLLMLARGLRTTPGKLMPDTL